LPELKPLEVPERIDQYEVRGLVAEGGVGVVYRAYEPSFQWEVAIKVLRQGPDGVDAREAERFSREAEAAAPLRHRNIVGVHAAGEHEGLPYVVMDFVDGVNLKEAIAAEGPIPPLRAAKLTMRLAQAVHYAHEQGVLHRDVKPSNVILVGEGEPVLADFGLARIFGKDGLTRTGEIMGTPVYMPPEQARGDRDRLGCWTDVYGLGATLYEMLTAQPPIRGATTAQVLRAVIAQTPKPPSKWVPVDPALEWICMRCLKKDPAERYPTAEALAKDLAHFLGKHAPGPAPASPEPSWEVGQRLGPYVVLGEVSKLGGDLVLRAQRDGAQVILKLLLDPSPKAERRFMQEGQVLRALEHDGIPRVVDAGELVGVPFLALRHVVGTRLDRYGAGYDWVWSVRFVAQLAHVLAYCHEHGVVHQAVKPDNVIVQAETSRPVLLGFGHVRRDRSVLSLPAIDSSHLFLSGEIKGEAGYLAPEQLDPELGDLGPAVDVYALGGVLSFLLTRRAPYEGPTKFQVLQRIRDGSAPELDTLPESLPRRLREIVRSALAADPADRPMSARLLAEMLESVLAAETAPARVGVRGVVIMLLVAGVAAAAAASFLGWGLG
jgi:serine/threonine protein kinase